MADAQKFKTIYVGQVPSHEVGLAMRAAQALGFTVETYGTGTYYDVTPTNKEITVGEGNNGVVLSCPEGNDAGNFWDKFFELKDPSSRSKEEK